MTTNYDNLDSTFNIESKIVEVEKVKEDINLSPLQSEDIKKDYEYTRANLYSLIEKGQEAINGIKEQIHALKSYWVTSPSVTLQKRTSPSLRVIPLDYTMRSDWLPGQIIVKPVLILKTESYKKHGTLTTISYVSAESA